jgi:NAD(P) transhydrogenase subunit alpha
MKVAIVKERQAHERRSTPDTVKRLVGMGLKVVVESGAGGAASFTDEAYQAAGGSIAADAATALAAADIVLNVRRPLRGGDAGQDELTLIRPGAVLIGMPQMFKKKQG